MHRSSKTNQVENIWIYLRSKQQYEHTYISESVSVADQSSDSSFQPSRHEDDDIMDIDVCPSPSPSNSISESPETSLSSSETSIGSHRKDIALYSDDELTQSNDSNNGQTKTMPSAEEQESDSESHDLSISLSRCRYCYTDIPRTDNVSTCLCTGLLCKECLIRELKLTHGRTNSLLQCTVCKV